MNEADQKIFPLEGDDAAHVEKQRDWVRNHFTPESLHKYDVFEEKLRLLQMILDSNWIKPGETWELQSLGITFGDALVQELNLLWVTVEDEYGCDPALVDTKTTTVVFPLTAISKRIERGDKVDIYELFDGFRDLIEKQRLAEKAN